eukprot:4677808-Prymnesium_polylepis.1
MGMRRSKRRPGTPARTAASPSSPSPSLQSPVASFALPALESPPAMLATQIPIGGEFLSEFPHPRPLATGGRAQGPSEGLRAARQG